MKPDDVNNTAKIFISYARKDGYDHSQILRTKLEDEGFEIWQDLIAMNIGENWHPQIFRAIDEASVVVLVLTSAALKSPMVRQEWVHARRVGTPIFPIAFSDIYKETDVPRWVKKVDAVIVSPDVVGSDDKWHSFLNQLRNPKPRNKVPNIVERLPAEYVDRHVLHNTVLNSLLDGESINPQHTDTTPHIVTLLGEGGFGKTSLSQAIGLDPNITEAFTGGVLSATIGESAANLGTKWNSML